MKKRMMIIGAVVAMSGFAALGTAAVTNAASAEHTGKGIVRRMEGDRAEAKLNQAVRDGVITDTQKQAFLTEAKTLRAERKSVITKDSTKDQRQAERTKIKSEMKAWATTNNFPLAKIFPKLAE